MKDEMEFVGGYVDAKLKKDLESIAEKEDRSLTWIVAKFLTEGVKHLKRKSPRLKKL